MADKTKILVVDDDEHIAELISLYLIREGYDTKEVYNGNDAVKAFEEYKPNLIMLDIMLPGLDGYGVCKEIRKTSGVPIIMLTAKGDTIDKVLGLELGADDYVTKPFGIRELMARVKANLRKRVVPAEIKKAEENKNVLTYGNLEIDNDMFEIRKGGEKIELTLREFELLKFLCGAKGQVFSREALMEKVWGYDYYGDVRTVDVTVRRLREKLEDDPSKPVYVLTKRGVGYYFGG